MAFPVRNSGICCLGFVKGSLASDRDARSGPLRTAGWDHPLPLVSPGVVVLCCGTVWAILPGVYPSLGLALLPVPACGWGRQLCISAPLQQGCSSRSTKSRCCSILLCLLSTLSISQLAANSLPQLLGSWQGWAPQSSTFSWVSLLLVEWQRQFLQLCSEPTPILALPQMASCFSSHPVPCL